jgi:hypothetical protein
MRGGRIAAVVAALALLGAGGVTSGCGEGDVERGAEDVERGAEQGAKEAEKGAEKGAEEAEKGAKTVGKEAQDEGGEVKRGVEKEIEE